MRSPAESEIVWLTEMQVRILHAEALNLFGGSPGIRDDGLLQSALARPQNRKAYEESSTLFDLAAAYGFGIAQNHAFIDGNKRVALLAVRAFLFRNRYHFAPDEADTVMMMEGVAGGTVTEAMLSKWIEDNSELNS
jgi:death-on-curing protein